MSVQSGRQRLLLSMLNDQLTCRLCGGYFIDATTIIECLHSFCRSCIVKYLEKSKYCPICEVQVHKSKPLLNIRPDHTLQDIVYKLVPGCYQNEMRCRREFYAKHPDAKSATMSPESKGEPVESHIYSPEESLSLSLEYHNPSVKTESDDEETETTASTLPRRYLRCPAAVTIFHLQKLIRAKYGLSEAHRVDILYKEEPLCSTYTLMDVMYIYHWRRKVPLHLSYRIFESSPKRIKLSEDNAEFKKSLSDSGIDQSDSQDEQPHREWKEVQLKISETGVMSITDITSSDSKRNVRTMELDEKAKSELNTIAGTKSSKELIEQDFKISPDTTKEKQKLRIKEEPEGTITRSATKLNASKAEEAKQRVEEKATKMDTRASSKEAGKSDKNTKDAKNDNQVLTNNNSISSEKESEDQKQQVKPSNAGSKINALSAKLQFQPKVGQVNNTYSKKGSAKEKKSMTQNLKSSDAKLSKQAIKVENKTESSSKMPVSSKVNVDKLEQTAKLVGTSTITATTTTATTTTTTSTPDTTSASNSLTTTTSTTIISATKTSSSSTTTSAKNTSSVRTSSTESSSITSVTISTSNVTTSTSSTTVQTSKSIPTSLPSSTTSATSTTANQNTVTQSAPKIQTSSEQSAVKSSTASSPAVSIENVISSCALSYTVKDMMNKNISSSGSSNNIASPLYSKSTLSSSSASSMKSNVTQFSIQTPVMSIYPTSMKNYFISSSSDATSITSTTTVTSSGGNPVKATSSAEIKMASKSESVFSSPPTSTTTTTAAKTETKTDSIPPCPDAIPLSMMKSTMRKNQLHSKGSSSDNSSKSFPGSKIDDICAKIGENSKEKNKLENRNKPEIPGLLEIPKKSSSAEQIMKQIPSIHVPIFKPSNKEANLNCIDSYKTLPSVSSHYLQPSVSASSQKGSSSKKRVSPSNYKTLRDPPRSWNPTLSKNNYLAIKNQLKELQQQQQAYACDAKQIPSKPSKIFTMRNTPRFLGNPASGVKAMYNVASETGKEKEQSTSTTSNDDEEEQSSTTKSHTVSMTKIDPQTLQPIVSMVPTYPFLTKVRTHQSGPFSSRNDIRSSSSPVSPRNSPVNMLSTSPFIPSHTPNTNPRLIYSTFPPFPNARRFGHPINPLDSPLHRFQPPLSAFHSSLPQVKFYQRSNYSSQGSGYGSVTQPPTVQRIPPTSHANPPKSPKTPVEPKSSSSSSLTDSKLDDAQKVKVTFSKKVDVKVFHYNDIIAKNDGTDLKQPSKLDFLAKISTAANVDRTQISPVPKNTEKNNEGDAKVKNKDDAKEEKNDNKEVKEDVKEHNRVNGDVVEISTEMKTDVKVKNDKVEEDKSSKKDTTNGATQNVTDKLEDDAWRKAADQTQVKKTEIQRNKAES